MRLEQLADPDVLCDFFQAANELFPVPLSHKTDLADYARKLIEKGIAFGFVGSEGRLVGAVAGYVNAGTGGDAFLSVIAVLPEASGSGLGGRLLAAFENRARRARCCRVCLTTHATNVGAQRFYASHGYRVDGTEGENFHLSKVVVGLTDDRPNLLLSSAGRRTYLVEWFKEALGNEGSVVVANSDALAPSMIAADVRVESPLIYSDEYIPFMLQCCADNQVGAVVPLFDIDVPVLARASQEFFDAGVFPVVAPLETALACNDKFRTQQVLRELGLASIPSFVSLEEAEEALNDGRLSFPVVVKPRWGMGSIGVSKVWSTEELRAEYAIVLQEIQDTYLRYESADQAQPVIIQQCMDGQECGMDVINDLCGGFRGISLRKKLAMRAGETDAAEVIPAEEPFMSLGRTLSLWSRHPGNMDLDVFLQDGVPYVLEMNGRFGGGYPFSHCAGVNEPAALVAWLRGQEPSPSELTPKDYGVYQKDIRIIRLT